MQKFIIVILYFLCFSSFAQDIFSLNKVWYMQSVEKDSTIISMLTGKKHEANYNNECIELYIMPTITELRGIFQYNIIPHYGASSISTQQNIVEQIQNEVNISRKNQTTFLEFTLGDSVVSFRIDSLSDSDLFLKDTISNKSYHFKTDKQRFFDNYLNHLFVKSLKKSVELGKFVYVFVFFDEEEMLFEVKASNISRYKIEKALKNVIKKQESLYIKERGKLLLVYPNESFGVKEIY